MNCVFRRKMFLHALSRAVPLPTRSKGARYFAAGAVSGLAGDASTADAVVRGTREYRVHVDRDESRFTASCECPYFADGARICKHIWAVLVASERHGLLGADVPPAAALSLHGDSGRPRADPSVNRSVGTTDTAAVPAWERFLADLRVEVERGERATQPPRFVDQQILYVLQAGNDSAAAPGLVLRLMTRQRKKTGDWSKPKPVGLSARELPGVPDEADREILSLLLGAVEEWSDSTMYHEVVFPGRAVFRVAGSIARRVLPLVGVTGRAFTAASADAPMQPVSWDPGAPWRFELRVRVVDDAGAPRSIVVDGELARNGERMAPTEPEFVTRDGFLAAAGRMAAFEAHDSFEWLLQLRRAGAVTLPFDAAGALVEALARSGVPPGGLPDPLRYEVAQPDPRPGVRVSRGPSGADPYYAREYLHAQVQFDYDGTLVDPGPGVVVYDAGRRRVVRRHAAAEARAQSRLQQLGFHYLFDHAFARRALVVGVEQFPRAVRTLVHEGWRVEADGRVFRAPRQLELRVSSGVDWFELHGSADFGDGQAMPIADLLAAIQRGEGTVALDDGTRGIVPEEWLRRYAGVARFGESFDDHVRFRPSQAALLDALLATQPAVSVDEAFSRARAALATFDRIEPLDPPPTFAGTLRSYQREALGWFAFLRRFGFGGCLADDMGLGKTVMVLALLLQRMAEHTGDLAEGDGRRPSLAVVPRSLVFNWIDEARRFAPALQVVDYTGAGRNLEAAAAADLVLTTYGTLRRDAAALRGVGFDYVILDEAQAIKNASTASARAVRLLDGRHRLALSGTPVENHVGELWSLFEFLNPGLLGSAAGFELATVGRTRMEREELALVARAVRPFILRRTKQQVAPELPARSEQTLYCELEGAQRSLYDQLRTHYRQSLLDRIAQSGLNRSKIQVLEALLRLRQAACHAGLVDEARAADASAKLDLLMPRLAELVEEGHKALVFSQFTSFLAILRSRLDAEGLAHEYLDGRTRDRAAHVERFQSDPACRLFLVSLKAGGLGLNLTAAEYVFLLDPWWNPAAEAQAIDRAHRIGQTEHVFAYRLIARDTVEEKIAELQQSKRELADAILSEDAGLMRDLKPEDLEWLLS